MDDADISQDRAEKEAPYLIDASRKPTGPTATGRCLYCDEIVDDTQRWCPTATGRCLYCDEIVGDTQRWCDTACRDGWVREEKLRGGVR